MEQLVEQESEDGMSGETPDFAGMIADGMTSTEREEQLRFETNPDGTFVEDDGIRRPRPSHQLRKFACDPEGHVQLDHSTGMFWTTDKVINYIVATEVEQDLITKVKRSKKGNATTKTAAPAATKTETSMAEGRRVMINRGGGKGKGAAKASGSRVARPPSKTAAKAAKAEDSGNGAEASAGVGFDAEALIEEVKLAVGEGVAQLLSDKFAEQEKRIDTLEKNVIEAITIAYDIGCQTEGRFAFEDEKGNTVHCDEMFRNPDMIRGYITGAETPPEE
jgi:hypothetical protein